MSAHVVLKVVEARNLAAADLNGKSDPFVVVECEGKERLKTRVVRKTLEPRWGEQTTFAVEDSRGNVVLNVWDWDQVGKDDSLGQESAQKIFALLDLGKVPRNLPEPTSMWLPVSRKGEVRVEVSVMEAQALEAQHAAQEEAERAAAAAVEHARLEALQRSMAEGQDWTLNALFWDAVRINRTTKQLGEWGQCRLSYRAATHDLKVMKQQIYPAVARPGIELTVDTTFETDDAEASLEIDNGFYHNQLPLKIRFEGAYVNGDLTPEVALQWVTDALVNVRSRLQAADPEWRAKQEVANGRRATLGPILERAGLPEDLVDYLCSNEEIGLTDRESLDVLEEQDFIAYGCTKVEARNFLKKIKAIE